MNASGSRPDQELFSLSSAVGERLGAGRQTVAVAESCTGGMLGAAFTDVPGSSAYFMGGVIAYADDVKLRQLGVPAGLLDAHGAVSAQAAAAMATGVRALLQADIGLSVTGVAGPAEEEHKPAGLTFIGLADGAAEATTRSYRWQGDRFGNRRESVRAALQLLLDSLPAMEKS